ncbi:hypothetical protein AQUCO_02900120v1 [Aquilegia coerulea]|uniref:Uncharacterized protein n=1 Tax=Aquilegia coerulea TaxID=218851 RepID=A0A2G5D3H1_AQUCA|nr:hypothetical protein AQUCO_02900120v1 [Aquilegia coerulea]
MCQHPHTAHKTYDRVFYFIEDDTSGRSTVLTFMDSDLEIMYEAQPTAKEMFELLHKVMVDGLKLTSNCLLRNLILLR